MKKTIIVIFSATTVVFNTHSQPIITSQALPQQGYIYLTLTDTMPVISIGTPGPAFQTWDFTMLNNHYPSYPTFDLTSNTPYAGDFPASNIYTYGPAAMFGGFYGGAPVGTQGYAYGYMFWRTDTTGYWIVGFRADSGTWGGINVYENPRELLVGTPSAYGSVFNNTARWELAVSAVNPVDVDTYYVNYVTKTLTADAWGYLQIPNSIGDTVLRIHENLIRVDSSIARLGGSYLYGIEIYRDTLNNYLYMSPGYNYPLAHVHADKNNNLNSVEYYTGMMVSAKPLESNLSPFNIFPNPSNGSSIQIHLNEVPSGKQDIFLRIYTLSGQEIFGSSMRTGKCVVNNDLFFSNGAYLINLFDGEKKIYDGKIVIEK
ncbi:MAG: T9SS type A sorting domain-containing protein [Bacteroidetes bacterium]|nr:T9SS type A sorting domain-containing protein [Bacteroidota bacterium]